MSLVSPSFNGSGGFLPAKSDSDLWSSMDSSTAFDASPFAREAAFGSFISHKDASGECDTSNINSYDERDMSQFVSSSKDPIVCYPAMTCLFSAQVLSSANETSSSIYFVPRNDSSDTQHGNLLCNVDDNYLDKILCIKKEPGSDQYSLDLDGCVKGSITGSKREGNHGSGNSLITTTDSSLGNEATTKNSTDYSKVAKLEYRTEQLNLTDPIASSSGQQYSSELLDELNPDEDSPCWKGTLVSQKFRFGVDGMIDRHLEEKKSKGSDDLDREQKHIPVTAQCLRTSPEKDGGQVFNFSSNISFSETGREFSAAKGSRCVEVGSCFACEVVKNSEEDSGVDRNGNQLVQKRTWRESANSLLVEDEDVFQDKPSSVNLDTRSVVKAMHGLSEMLLSSSYEGDDEWDGCDHFLVKLVLDNLETFAARNKKVSVARSNETEGHLQSISDEFVRNFNELESKIIKKEQDPQAAIFKSLWMQAEAVLCSMKHELELARMKLQGELGKTNRA